MTSLLPVRYPEHVHFDTEGAPLVRHEYIGEAIGLHCFLKAFQCSLLVPRPDDEIFRDFSLVINRTPKVVPLSVDLCEHLIEMPPSVARFHNLDTALPDLGGKYWSETMPPEPLRFVADFDASFVQRVLNIAK